MFVALEGIMATNTELRQLAQDMQAKRASYEEAKRTFIQAVNEGMPVETHITTFSASPIATFILTQPPT